MSRDSCVARKKFWLYVLTIKSDKDFRVKILLPQNNLYEYYTVDKFCCIGVCQMISLSLFPSNFPRYQTGNVDIDYELWQ